MKATPFRNGKYWRVIVPKRLNGTGKSKSRYFKSEDEANAEIERLQSPDGDLDISEFELTEVDYLAVTLTVIEDRKSEIQRITFQANDDIVIEFR